MKSYVEQYFADISILAYDICQGVDLTKFHKVVQWQGKWEDYVMAGKHKNFYSRVIDDQKQ